eukprot:g525.t1
MATLRKRCCTKKVTFLLTLLVVANVFPATSRSPPTKGFFITWDSSTSLAMENDTAKKILEQTPLHTAGTIDFKTGKVENVLDNSYFYSYGASTSSVGESGDVYTYSLLPEDDLGHVTKFQLVEVAKNRTRAQMFWNATKDTDADHAPGAVQCDSAKASCYAFTFGNTQRENALVKFYMNKDDASVVVNFAQYDGYTIDASALDKKNSLYYAILVCIPPEGAKKEHGPVPIENTLRRKHVQMLSGKLVESMPNLSDQCLVTVDLTKKKILHSVSVSKDMMGPLVHDDILGLLTFNPTLENCACSSIDTKTGKETCVENGSFGGFPYFHMLTSNDGYFFGQFIRPNTKSKSGIVVGDLRTKPMQLLVNMSWDFDIHAPVLLP